MNKNKFGLLIAVFLSVLFQLVVNQTPPQPPTFSDNCFNWNNNLTVCQQCNEGFYLEYFLCIPCNSRCLCTSKNDYCQSCYVVQYNNLNFYSYLQQTLNQCILCNTSMPYCLQCQNLNICTKCWNGQYLVQQKDKNNVLIRQYCSVDICTPNCQICINHNTCSQCQQGYFLFLNKTCSVNPCSVNCTNCSSIDQCSVCQSGYYLNVPTKGKSSCELCMANCTQCTSQTNCLQCAPSFYLQNNSCVNSGLGNCIQYANTFQTCTSCQPGYQITLGNCNQCIGCELCAQPFICLTPCLPGYQPFNFACIPSFQFKFYFQFIIMIFYLFLIY